ncbi:MAG: phosphotriesterase, partial [Bacteroidetes bacterium]|nr:phosphotriesterase [Bacteroidota bacterium]
TTLIHEHVFLDWSGADSIQSEEWDNDAAFQTIIPFLEEVKTKGVTTILECTPNYLGRNPNLLQRLSEVTGIQFLTNTGYYGAVDNKYLPQKAFDLSAEEISAIWTKEYQEGLDGTGIKPGFIKISVNSDSILSNVHKKLVKAAALTRLRTGLTIVGHTGPEKPAMAQVKVLAENGVSPEAFVWTHAQGGTMKSHIELAKMGVWVSLDGMGWMAPDSTQDPNANTLEKYLDMIENFKENKLLHKLLISHDAGWYTHDPEDGQQRFKPYTSIFDRVIPGLKERGFTEMDIEQLLVKNPQRAYGLVVRALH